MRYELFEVLEMFERGNYIEVDYKNEEVELDHQRLLEISHSPPHSFLLFYLHTQKYLALFD